MIYLFIHGLLLSNNKTGSLHRENHCTATQSPWQFAVPFALCPYTIKYNITSGACYKRWILILVKM